MSSVTSIGEAEEVEDAIEVADADSVASEEAEAEAATPAASFAAAAASAAEDGGVLLAVAFERIFGFFDWSITTGGAKLFSAGRGRGPFGTMCVNFLLDEINGRVKVKLLLAGESDLSGAVVFADSVVVGVDGWVEDGSL